MGITTVFVLGALLLQASLAAQVEVSPVEALVLPRQNVTFMCRVAVPLQYCRVEIPGKSSLNLNPQLSTDNVKYYGAGLQAGQCGFTINSVDERNNGVIKCTLGIATESQESVGQMHLVVAKPPRAPELQISNGADGERVYKIHEHINAFCLVRDGRPVANISWYIDDELLLGEGLSMPRVVDIAKENVQSKSQNLTRQLRASDNGKRLKCVAYHPAYPNGVMEASRQLEVIYGPQPLEEPLEQFGYTIGKPGSISLVIQANPRPIIEWKISGQSIKEGDSDNTGRMEASPPKELGQGRYEVSLRLAAVSKEDTEKDYVLVAQNREGRQIYNVRISTRPEPEGIERFIRQQIHGLDLGVGSIIGIVVAICFILAAIFLVIFARLTGRWCFAGNRERQLRESDTESADGRPKNTKTNLIPVKLTSLFKKDKNRQSDKDEPKAESNVDLSKETLDTTLATEIKDPESKEKEGVVYVELDLTAPTKAVVKNDSDKTEYAEIVYTPKDGKKDGDK